MEPTDLNALVKEFTNLSYHGMRAGKDAIDVDIELDLDKTIGDVPLIAEDFSRVILNLCNNAFDAMSENAKGKCWTTKHQKRTLKPSKEMHQMGTSANKQS
jgi:signal transduction histidine kinase